MSQLLPEFPHLEHLKGQAKDVLRVVRRREPTRTLSDAQHAIARGYGFASWPHLKAHVDSVRRQSAAPLRSRAHASPACDRHDDHPIVGTWILNLLKSTLPPHLRQEGVIVEFGMAGTSLTMTQVMVARSGDDIAVKLTIRGDGAPHTVRFGKGFHLEARWSEAGSLEAIVRSGEDIVSRGTYHVSPDGQTLSFTTAANMLLFDRAGER